MVIGQPKPAAILSDDLISSRPGRATGFDGRPGITRHLVDGPRAARSPPYWSVLVSRVGHLRCAQACLRWLKVPDWPQQPAANDRSNASVGLVVFQAHTTSGLYAACTTTVSLRSVLVIYSSLTGEPWHLVVSSPKGPATSTFTWDPTSVKSLTTHRHSSFFKKRVKEFIP
jgi:hypothetical protein